jgi:hypothetical protein
MAQDDSLNMRDYLDAASSASTRTRAMVITIVVASILIFGGFLNSLQHNWMLQRVRKAADPYSGYFETKFPNIAPDALQSTRDQFKDALLKAYVDNTYTIRVPFFAITFDVNDLALLGGIAFLIILILFWLSLNRELDNLKFSFEKANSTNQLADFYNLLSMQQVLTTPPKNNKEAIRFFTIPKVLSVLPLIVLTLIIGNDFMTYDLGALISVSHTNVQSTVSSALWIVVLIFTIRCIRACRNVDIIWREYCPNIQQDEITESQSES